MNSLNVAIINPTYYPVPPKAYGGIEIVTYDLARAVADLGHEVTMIAAHGSEHNPKYHLVEVSGGKMDFNDEAVAFKEYQDLLGAFDIVSDHTHSHWVYEAKMLRPDITIQTTQHSQVNFTPPKSPNPNVPLPEPKPYNMCGLSNYHSRECSGITGIPFRCLYNGIDLDRYKYKEKKGTRLLYIGRMEPFKGAHWALYTAKVLRMPLDLIGKDQDTNQEYVRQLKQEITNMKTAGYDVNYLGEVPHETKVELLADAYAVLFAALWNEPYGLIPVEAMACVPSDTLIDTEFVLATHSRSFEGKLIEITTDNSRKLLLTPNHAVYTTQGWLPAGVLSVRHTLFITEMGNIPIGELVEEAKNRFGQNESDKFIETSSVLSCWNNRWGGHDNSEAMASLIQRTESANANPSSSNIEFVTPTNALSPIVTYSRFLHTELPKSARAIHLLNQRHQKRSTFLTKNIALLGNQERESRQRFKFHSPTIRDGFARKCITSFTTMLDRYSQLKLETVKRIKRVKSRCFVYNLTTSTSDYFANGILVHNCGTPVIATATGALPEIVKHGTTGWLANTLDEFAQLTLRAPQINPADCLAWVTERFSSKIMAERYVEFWRQILNNGGW